jgi:hypothetical protein
MSFKNYKSRTNRIINPTYDSKGVIIKPITKKNYKKKKANTISYKDKTINRYKLGPLDKLLQCDKPAKPNSKRQTSKGLLTLNSFIDFGIHKGKCITDIFITHKQYLIHLADRQPQKFSYDLLKQLI